MAKTKVRAGENVWVRYADEYGTIAETCIQPDWPEVGEDEENDWYPLYAEPRVQGDTYTYYNGSSDWVKAANAAMASAANSNFRRSQSF